MFQPIIVVLGMPRSGTTWLGKIFDSHPGTYYLHEPDSMEFPSDIPLIANEDSAGAYRSGILSFIERASRMRSTKVCGTLPIFEKSYLSPVEFYWHKYSVFLAKLGAKAFGEFPVLDIRRSARGRHHCLTWKSIESVGRSGLIARCSSRIRLVFEIRHPCGYVSSVIRGRRQGRFSEQGPADVDRGIMRMLLETSAARRRNLAMEQMEELSPEERLAWQWVLFNEKAITEIADLDNCTILRYEDLCEDPLKTARTLFDFTGLSWEGQTEEFLKSSTSRDQQDYYSIIRDPARAAYRWKEQLSEQEKNRIMSVAIHSIPGAYYASDSA